jgi:hypothetical protein
VSRREQFKTVARKGWLIPVLLVVFLTVGVPRWLAGDAPRGGSDAGANFSKVCRDHGGTPAPDAQRCTVRYGTHVYLMDAITPDGFDEDTAGFQRQGCAEARRQARAATPPGHRRRSFVYHATTGVCERRP